MFDVISPIEWVVFYYFVLLFYFILCSYLCVVEGDTEGDTEGYMCVV